MDPEGFFCEIKIVFIFICGRNSDCRVEQMVVRLAGGCSTSHRNAGFGRFLIAAFVTCFGTNAARRLLFPLSFLFLLIPIPSFLLLKIVQSLQHGSAIAASLLFSAAGVPVSRTGVLVSIPGLTVEVARECSSIRSSLMLLVTTMVLTHVLLRTTWKQMLVVLLVVPLSVAKNGIRIFTLGILATRVDPSYLRGHLHHDGGIIFLMLALAIIGIVIWLLRRHEDVLSKQPSSTSIIAPLVPEFIESKPWI